MRKCFMKIIGLSLFCFALSTASVLAIGGSEQKSFADSAVGASGQRYMYLNQPTGGSWPDVDYAVFFVRITAPSGTVTATVEMLDGADVYNLDFFVLSSTSASGNPVATSPAPTTAGNYIIAVRLSDFGNQVLGPIRLKIATAAASGVTVGGKSSMFAGAGL